MPIRATLTERFLTKFKVVESGCWEWTASMRGTYGKLWVGHSMQAAHRVSYLLHCGPIPDGMCVCHRCDNRICVNPGHLFLGTQAANLADRDAKGRGVLPALRGTDCRHAKLTEKDVASIRTTEGLTQDALAKKYGVDQSLISLIRSGKIWAHLA